tara:strand:- start:1285 stop:2190 length:906 start_codon:yes stop_codon:yes gene_type:complete
MAEESVEESVEEDTGQDESTESTESTEEATEKEPASEDASSWRDLIKDDSLHRHAERFTDIDALLQANLDSRKKLSKAVNKPEEGASDEDMASYRESIGVPKDVDGYDFPLPEGVERTEQMMDAEDHWANLFIEHDVPKGTADVLVSEFRGELEKMMNAQTEADQAATDQATDSLRKEWGGEYDKNLIYAARASEKLFGDQYEDARFMEDKSGKFILDNPLMVKMFARLGREMGEGSLGAVATSEEKESLMDKANEFRTKRMEAHAKGNNAEARKWDERERDMLGKIYGDDPAVGTKTRNM